MRSKNWQQASFVYPGYRTKRIRKRTKRMAIVNRARVSFCNQPCTFLHILASPEYAPETVAVNVTWMERGFNASQTHSSIYPSMFNRLRAIARYWSEIATFSYPLAFNAPVGAGCVPIGIPGQSLVPSKLESLGYQAVKTV